MKTIRFAVGIVTSLAIGLTLSVVPAQGAFAAPVNPSAATSETAPGANPAIPAGTPRKTTVYKIPLTSHSAGGVQPQSLPSGCHLVVLLTRSGNILTGSMTTSCSFIVNSIDQTLYLYRSRWFGWEKIAANEEVWSYNVYSQGISLSYDCGGTGTHNFQVQGMGYVNKGGTSYNASAYDEIDNVSC